MQFKACPERSRMGQSGYYGGEGETNGFCDLPVPIAVETGYKGNYETNYLFKGRVGFLRDTDGRRADRHRIGPSAALRVIPFEASMSRRPLPALAHLSSGRWGLFL